MLCKVFIDKDTGEELASYAALLESEGEEYTTRELLAGERGIDPGRIGVKLQNRVCSMSEKLEGVESENGVRYYFRRPGGVFEALRLSARLFSRRGIERLAARLRADPVRVTFVAGEVVKVETTGTDGKMKEVDWF